MAGPRTAVFGRFLSRFGGLWILAALITAFVAPQGVGVPLLPGILIYVAGKVLTALGRRGEREEEEGAEQQTVASGQPQPTPPPVPEQRPVSRRNEYLEEHSTLDEPGRGSEDVFELPDLEEAILEAPPPMTSEEMVAEARRRFGPHPVEEED